MKRIAVNVRIAAHWLLYEVHAEAAQDLGGVLTDKWKMLREWYCGAILTINCAAM